jgi:hypothetical protein
MGRELRKCFKCGGERVYLEKVDEALPGSTSMGGENGYCRFQCLDCEAIVFNYQWLANPDRYDGPSYLD